MTYPSAQLPQARPDLDMVAMSQDLLAAQQGFIGSQIVPDLPVTSYFGKYPYVDNATWLKDPFEQVAPMGAIPRYEIDFGEKSFQCEELAFEMPINRERQILYKDWLDLEKYTAEAARTMAAYHREAHAVSLFNNDSCYGTSTAVQNQWTDHSNATPIADLKALVETIGDKCGMDPNTIVMSKTTFGNMVECEEVIDRVKFATATSGRVVDMTATNLAEIIGVKQILIGGTRIAVENGGTRTYPRLWTNSRVAAFVALEGKEKAGLPHWASRVVYKPSSSVDYGQKSLGAVSNVEFYSYGDPRARSEIIQCLEYATFMVADINCAGKLTNICA